MRIKEGDVFSIPINKQYYGIGQVIKIPFKDCLFIVVYEQMISIKDITVDIISDLTPFLMGNTVDALFANKRWKIIGNNMDNINNITLPIYKVGDAEGGMFITDFKGDTIRKASKNEFEKLEYMSGTSPITFETALSAHHGFGDWDEDDNEFLYNNIIENRKMLS